MTDRVCSSSSVLTKYGFLMLFVGFFVYWAAVSAGVVPRFLGGFAPAMSALCIGLFIAGTVSRGFAVVNRLDVGMLVFMTLLAFLTGWGFAFRSRIDVLESNVSMLLQWGALYLVFRGIEISRSSLRIFLFSIVAMGFFIVRSFLDGLSQPLFYVDPESLPTYQAYGFYFAIAALLALAVAESVALRAVVVVGSLALLVIVGSRSELVLFTVGFVVIALRRLSLSSLAIQVAIVVSGGALLVPLAEFVEGNRIVWWFNLWREQGELVGDPLRPILNEEGVRMIGEHPLMGSFAYYEPGQYAHNILSLWAEFGMLPFLLYCALLCVAFWAFIKAPARRCDGDGAADFGLAVLVGGVVLLVAAKSYGYFTVPVALGVASAMLKRETNGWAGTVRRVQYTRIITKNNSR
jgi:hypothetical protein